MGSSNAKKSFHYPLFLSLSSTWKKSGEFWPPKYIITKIRWNSEFSNRYSIMDFVETIIDNDILYKSEKDINVYYSSDQHHDNSVKKNWKFS